MKILFVATNLPIPDNNGAAIRSLSIIRALASSGHSLSFVSLAKRDRPKDLHPLSSYCRSIDLLDHEMTNLTAGSDYLHRIGSLVAFRSYSVGRLRSAAMREKIQEKLKMAEYELIVSDGIHALTNVPKTAVPIVLNCHNIEYVILERYAQLERNPLAKFYARVESRLLRTAERHGYDRASLAMVCSQVDLEILRQLRANLPTFIVPNVVDTDLIQPVDSSAPNSTDPVILFQGGMDWFPNRDAVEYFARTILPRVRRESPEVKFIVAGRNPPAQFVEQFRSDPRIKFTGTIPDMRPYLAAATVVIVPLRIGGGTRIKILEACAAGKPIVSTSIGAEGLSLEAGKEIILADEPVEFARSVVNFLQDPVLSATFSKLSREAVTERYSYLTLKKSLDALFTSLRLGNGRGFAPDLES